MLFPRPLVQGTLVRRYKRFLADVTLEDGQAVTAHCPNSGSMLGVTTPGAAVWLSPAANPARKSAWTWELIRAGESLVGINTGHPNALVAEAIKAEVIPELVGYPTLRREVKYGRNSRIDVLLEAPDKPACYIEIKNVHMKRGDSADVPAEFPDSVTARGTKHLAELAEQVAAGNRAVMLYVVQRNDCSTFRIADDIDPVYAAGLTTAQAAGVEVMVYGCNVSTEGIRIAEPLRFVP